MKEEGERSNKAEEIRDELVTILVESCPVSAVIRDRGKGTCPNYGPSGTCVDCMYPWVEIAERSIEVAKKQLKLLKDKKHEKKVISMRETKEAVVQIDHEMKQELTVISDNLDELQRLTGRLKNKMAESVYKLSQMFAPFRDVPDAPASDDVVPSDDHG